MVAVTDQERADNWLVEWLDWLPASERDHFTALLVAEFAEVRRSERQAAGEILVHRATERPDLIGRRALRDAAIVVEFGEQALQQVLVQEGRRSL